MALDSAWGYANTTLTDPAPPPSATDSPWGVAYTTLVDPVVGGVISDSPWGTATVTLRRPHHPIGVRVGSTVRYVPLLSYDGADWR